MKYLTIYEESFLIFLVLLTVIYSTARIVGYGIFFATPSPYDCAWLWGEGISATFRNWEIKGDRNLYISCGITLPLSCKTLFNHSTGISTLESKREMNFAVRMLIQVFLFSGSLQSWKTSVQILSSTTASQRSIIDKWAQSFSAEERSDAANGHAT